MRLHLKQIRAAKQQEIKTKSARKNPTIPSPVSATCIEELKLTEPRNRIKIQGREKRTP
ncbi:hypothetical protein Scep_026751 [Stephania cephalantha]|uniref:Uncharacterized protein n=1 Tax=Stephania cephalantha TaxID=152367 RepID=A0AAP0ER27_9MAGN